jgi:hypothetical protein
MSNTAEIVRLILLCRDDFLSDTDIKWFEKECWQSTKYPFDQMDAKEMKRTWVPELGMTLGAAISALKQSWTAFKLNKDRGEPGRVWYYADTINRMQDALSLEMTQFDL